MTLLQVQLFDGFHVSYGGNRLATLDTPRLQELVAFLLLHRGQTQFRYYLANLFWPDSPETQARTNLRKLIFLLRQALPDFGTFITMNVQTLTWRADAPCILDVAAFEQALSAKPGQALGLENIERAIALYRGDLLPSCYEDWMIPIRQRLRLAYQSALESASAMHEDRRNNAAALAYAQQLAQADPLSEPAACRLMRMYALTDDRGAAVSAYRDIAARLRAELGVEPGPGLQELYNSLQEPAQSEGVKQLTLQSAPALVGRQAEWQKIQACWRKASAGSPHLLLITGEAGIGKTRLMEELLRWATRQGICTAWAQAFQAEGNLSYAPVTAWLRANPLPRLDGVWLQEIARLLPEILKDHPEIPEPGIVFEAWQRQRLFEALSRAILGNCQKRLLLLDDAQWSDRDTLEWLHYLLRQDSHARLLIVLTVRSEEVTGSGHPLVELQSAINQMGACAEIALGPLSEAETAQLAGQVAGQAFSAEEAAALYRETEGSPLFVVETLRAGLRMDEALPGKVRAVLAMRIGQLSPGTRELVGVAATIGRTFSLEVLQLACEASDREFAEGMDELLDRRIVREYATVHAARQAEPPPALGVPVLDITYDFSHDRLREAAFGGLSTAHRRLLHRRVADALRDLAGGRPADFAAEIASHYDRAGMASQALGFYWLAGTTARNIFANQEAVRCFRRALELAGSLADRAHATAPQMQAKVDLLEQYGQVLQITGKFKEALAAFQQATAEAASLAPPERRSAVWHSSILRRISDVQVSLYDHPAALETLEEAQCRLGLAEQPAALTGTALSAEQREWIAIQFAKIQWMYWENRLEEMDRLIGQVQTLVDRSNEAEMQFELLGLSCQAEMRRENYRLSDRTVAITRRKRDLQFASKTPIAACYAEFQYGFVLYFNKRAADACLVLEAARIEAEKLGSMTLLSRVLNYLALCYRSLDDADGVARVTERLMEVTVNIGEHAYEGIAWTSRAWLAWKKGEMEQAYHQAKTALDIWEAFPYGFTWSAYWPLLDISLRWGKLDEAQHYARALLDANHRPLIEPVRGLLSTGFEAINRADQRAAVECFENAVREAQRNAEF